MPDNDMILKLIYEGLPDEGRYASDPEDDAYDVRFYRMTRGTKASSYAGLKMLQVQSSETWNTCYVWGDDGELLHSWRPQLGKYLQELLVNYRQCALQYAVLSARCARCGIALTDPDSRMHLVGPECIKYWPWMVELAADYWEKVNS